MIHNGINSGLLSFTTDSHAAVENSDYLFICVGTPSDSDGSADLSYVMQVAATIAEQMTSRKVVITKSTVPVGTTDAVQAHIEKSLAEQGRDISIETASNPEFLKEGSAVSDCQSPDRIVIGTRSAAVLEDLRRMYQAFNRNREKIMATDPRSAEMIKYASNAMLATKISFMNEMANIAETVGADIEDVRRGMGSDPRIGYQFIYPGAGYGGSCFPKDVQALKHIASERGGNAAILSAVHDTNQRQKNKLAEKLIGRLGADLAGKTIAVWGLAFKPNTDDMREATSRYLMDAIWSSGGQVRAYDPQANAACEAIYGSRSDMVLCEHKETHFRQGVLFLPQFPWLAGLQVTGSQPDARLLLEFGPVSRPLSNTDGAVRLHHEPGRQNCAAQEKDPRRHFIVILPRRQNRCPGP